MTGFEEMRDEEVVAADHHPPLVVEEDEVRGAVAGAVEHPKGSVAQREGVPVAERSRDRRRPSRRCRNAAPTTPSTRDEVVRDAVAAHDLLCVQVVVGGAGGVVGEPRRERRERGDLARRSGGR